MVIDSFVAAETFIPRGTPLPAWMTAEQFGHHRLEWTMFFASVYSLQEHPGMNRENARAKSISECAVIADKMLIELSRRVEGGIK